MYGNIFFKHLFIIGVLVLIKKSKAIVLSNSPSEVWHKITYIFQNFSGRTLKIGNG